MLRGIRAAALAAIAVLLLLPQAGSAERYSRVKRVSSLDSALVAQVNSFRVAHGLTTLRVSPFLGAAARAHSTQMARLGYFSHNSANGTPFWRRIQGYYPAAGFRYWSVGENLLWSSPSVDAASALRMWMQSPEHRANLLNRGWREVGVSAVHAVHAPGVYGGREVTIVTSDFGVRR